MRPFLDHGDVTVHAGDCIEVMRAMPAESVDAVVCDPPYGLEFMGREWDSFRKAGSEWSQKRATGKDWKGRERERPGRLYMRSQYYTCRTCGRQKHQHDDSACTPDYVLVTHEPTQMRAFQEWCEAWAREALRVLKPGGHLIAFGGTRTFHRLTCGIEDAGFEIRDCLSWLYGSGFPKSLDVSKAIDKAAGAEREVVGTRVTGGMGAGRLDAPLPPSNIVGGARNQFKSGQMEVAVTAPATPDAERWQGWGTALKPAWEPAILARKPLAGTVAANVLAHGTGALNIDGCRIGTDEDTSRPPVLVADTPTPFGRGISMGGRGHESGRWPANVALDEHAAAMLDEQAGERPSGARRPGEYGGIGTGAIYGDGGVTAPPGIEANTGGPSRFYYTAKAGTAERGEGNTHPTVKPIDLMRWLVRLVTPPGGVVLDPFLGSGTTALACRREGFQCIGIEREPEYLEIIRRRVEGEPHTLFGEVA